MSKQPLRRVHRAVTETAPPKRLASIQSGAEYADLSVRTIRRYIATGRLTGYRVGPRLIKVDLDEVDRLAQRIPTARGGVA